MWSSGKTVFRIWAEFRSQFKLNFLCNLSKLLNLFTLQFTYLWNGNNFTSLINYIKFDFPCKVPSAVGTPHILISFLSMNAKMNIVPLVILVLALGPTSVCSLIPSTVSFSQNSICLCSHCSLILVYIFPTFLPYRNYLLGPYLETIFLSIFSKYSLYFLMWINSSSPVFPQDTVGSSWMRRVRCYSYCFC